MKKAKMTIAEAQQDGYWRGLRQGKVIGKAAGLLMAERKTFTSLDWRALRLWCRSEASKLKAKARLTTTSINSTGHDMTGDEAREFLKQERLKAKARKP